MTIYRENLAKASKKYLTLSGIKPQSCAFSTKDTMLLCYSVNRPNALQRKVGICLYCILFSPGIKAGAISWEPTSPRRYVTQTAALFWQVTRSYDYTMTYTGWSKRGDDCITETVLTLHLYYIRFFKLLLQDWKFLL